LNVEAVSLGQPAAQSWVLVNTSPFGKVRVVFSTPAPASEAATTTELAPPDSQPLVAGPEMEATAGGVFSTTLVHC
jgi:hypothetical protein